VQLPGYLGRDDLIGHVTRSTRHGPTGRCKRQQPSPICFGTHSWPDPPHIEHVTRLPPINRYLGKLTYRIVQCTLPIPWHLGQGAGLTDQNSSARRLSWVCSVIIPPATGREFSAAAACAQAR
jgi:hypothetical protein